MSETILQGGRTRLGVVKIDETVRRPLNQNSQFASSLLKHLEAVGFSKAPRYLGRDDQDRDILTFIKGDVPHDLGWFSDEVLTAAAELILEFHNATVTLLNTNVCNQLDLEVVCHNDLSPCNFVFSGNLPIGIIDFDMAAPGPRKYDLGYAAWLWLDIGNKDIDAREQARRLALFAASYARHLHLTDLLNSMIQRQKLLISDGDQKGNESMQRWARDCLDWTITHLLPRIS